MGKRRKIQEENSKCGRRKEIADCGFKKTEVRDQRSEVRGQRSEIRGQRSEVRETGYRRNGETEKDTRLKKNTRTLILNIFRVFRVLRGPYKR